MSKCHFWRIPIVIIFIFCLLAGYENTLCEYNITGDNEMLKHVSICFNGKTTDLEGYIFNDGHDERYVLIPFVQILEMVGIKFQWDPNGDAYLLYKNHPFCLSPERGSFYPYGKDWKTDNWFELPPGDNGHILLFKGEGRNFIVDMEYSSGILLDLGYRIHFSDREDIVSIFKVR